MFAVYNHREAVLQWWEAGASIKKTASFSVKGGFCGASQDEAILLTRGPFGSKTLYVYDVRNPVEAVTKELQHSGAVYWAALSKDGKRVAAVAERRDLKIWSFPDGQEIGSAEIEPYRVIALSPDGNRVASDGRIWELKRNTLHQRMFRGFGTAVAFTPNSKYIAYNAPAMIELYSAATGDRVARFHPSSPIKGTFAVLTFSRDGTILMAGDSSGKLRWWKVPRQFSE